ncbi:MAG: hypothetical protein MR414_05195 [Bacteroidales bacterium]|nr:hypothetical protein [Bacteroidales bacterium]
MKAYTCIDKGHFALLEKPEPLITHRYSLEEIEITLKKGKIGVSISTANRRIEDWKVSG